jgi:hypothetical protein
MKTCGRTYHVLENAVSFLTTGKWVFYISLICFQTTVSDASLQCMQIGLQLVSVETLSELECLKNLTKCIKRCYLYHFKLMIHLDEITKINSTFWTSGSNEGLNCDIQRVFSWCSLALNLTAQLSHQKSEFWAENATLQTLANEKCLALQYTKSNQTAGLILRDCEKKLPAICEVYEGKYNKIIS